MKKRDHITVIAKPTHDCNLACKYCYIGDEAEQGKMDSSLLEESIKKISDFAQDSSWIWHGGEPLLMGLDFFREVKEVQDFYKKKGKCFSNTIQSNGTLITNELLNFISSTKDFGIGTSLDGPKSINDKTRIFKDGLGAYDKIMSGIKLRKSRGEEIGIISVINKQNVHYPKKMYKFFKTEKLHVKLNPLIPSGRATQNLGDLGITPREYKEFLKEMWQVYNEDSIRHNKMFIEIDPFTEVIGNLVFNRTTGCHYSSSCRDFFISIGPQGDLYPCGRFDGEKDFWLGNIKLNKIEDSLNSETNKILEKRNAKTVEKSCKSCNVYNLCNSGCMHNAYLSGDIMKQDPYCVAYKELYRSMNLELEKENES